MLGGHSKLAFATRLSRPARTAKAREALQLFTVAAAVRAYHRPLKVGALGVADMRVLIDGLGPGAEWADLSDHLLQVLEERGAVVVEVMIHHDEARVADASDQRVSDRFAGKPLARLLGQPLADSLAGWTLSDAPGHRLEMTVLQPGVANDVEHMEPRATRTRLGAIRDRVGHEGCLYLVLETVEATRDAREELGFLALRRELENVRSEAGRLQAQLDGVEEERRQAAAFSASVADLTHELRSTLSGMSGLIGYMSGRPLKDEDREHVVLLKDTADAMLSLLNGSLRRAQDMHAEVSAGLAGPMHREGPALASEVFEIKSLIDALAASWTVAAAQAGVTMRRAGDDLAGFRVCGDQLRLRQVLTNILGNAVKFSEAGGSILLVTTRDSIGDDTAVYHFEITDCGPGIDAEVRNRLFERGAHGGTGSGAGLGLSISRELISAMGGSIRADDAPGGGTRMTVAVPLVEARTPTTGSPRPLRERRVSGWRPWRR